LEISEDATWVAAARDGDRAAFGQLYERYARMVHGVLLAKIPVGDVDDLVQDVFIRALRRLSTLRETQALEHGWQPSLAMWRMIITVDRCQKNHCRMMPLTKKFSVERPAEIRIVRRPQSSRRS
jgi:hypothetical protein